MNSFLWMYWMVHQYLSGYFAIYLSGSKQFKSLNLPDLNILPNNKPSCAYFSGQTSYSLALFSWPLTRLPSCSCYVTNYSPTSPLEPIAHHSNLFCQPHLRTGLLFDPNNVFCLIKMFCLCFMIFDLFQLEVPKDDLEGAEHLRLAIDRLVL